MKYLLPYVHYYNLSNFIQEYVQYIQMAGSHAFVTLPLISVKIVNIS